MKRKERDQRGRAEGVLSQDFLESPCRSAKPLNSQLSLTNQGISNNVLFGNDSANERHLNVSGQFIDTTFASRYQRNNKKHSLKNLRCFPSCGFRHKQRGFCGRSVLFKVSERPFQTTSPTKRSRLSQEVDRTEDKFEDILCFSEFVNRVSDDDEAEERQRNSTGRAEGSNVYIGTTRVGSVLSLREALQKSRTKTNPLLPWLFGDKAMEKKTDHSIVFEFNKQRRGWHYGWQSNKHTCDTLHCLRVYIFKVLDSQEASSMGTVTGEHTSEILQNASPEVSTRDIDEAADQELLTSFSLNKDAMETSTAEPSNLDRKLVCVAVVESDPFMLFCRRRRRFMMTPSAPLSLPHATPQPEYEEHSAVQRIITKKRRLQSPKVEMEEPSTLGTSGNFERRKLARVDNTMSQQFSASAAPSSAATVKIDRLMKVLIMRMKQLRSQQQSNLSIMKTDRDDLLEDLARYLLNEKPFCSHLTDFFTQCSKAGSNTQSTAVKLLKKLSPGDKKYDELLTAFKQHLQTYRRMRNISISEFDRFFSSMGEVRQAVMSANPSSRNSSQQPSLHLSPASMPHIKQELHEEDKWSGPPEMLVECVGSFEDVAKQASNDFRTFYVPAESSQAKKTQRSQPYLSQEARQVFKSQSNLSVFSGLSSATPESVPGSASASSIILPSGLVRPSSNSNLSSVSSIFDDELDGLMKDVGIKFNTSEFYHSTLPQHRPQQESAEGNNFKSRAAQVRSTAKTSLEISAPFRLNEEPDNRSYWKQLGRMASGFRAISTNSRMSTSATRRLESVADIDKFDEFLDTNFDDLSSGSPPGQLSPLVSGSVKEVEFKPIEGSEHVIKYIPSPSSSNRVRKSY